MMNLVTEYLGALIKAGLDHIDRHPKRLLMSNGAILGMACAEWILQIKMLLTIVLLILSCLVSGTTLYRKWFGKQRGKRDDE